MVYAQLFANAIVRRVPADYRPCSVVFPHVSG